MHEAVHPLVGLEINATRARAVAGSGRALPQSLRLDGESEELPLALSLAGRHTEVGRAGAELCRQSPHAACLNFLPHLGDGRLWSSGKHHLDAATALTLVFQHLRTRCSASQAQVVALPAYFNRRQIETVSGLATKVGLKGRSSVPLATVSTPLAAALAAYADQPWNGIALFADIDDHALTWTAVCADEDEVRVLDTETLPHLSLRVWKDRLLNRIAERCIRQSRRDPRESAAAEQMLYDQLDGVLEACRQGQLVEVVIQSATWCQNLMLRPEDVASCCEPFVQQTMSGMQALLAATETDGAPQRQILTAAATRLPGLLAGLAPDFDAPPAEIVPATDFGEALVDEPVVPVGPMAFTELTADAPARAAHGLAARLHRGEWQPGHYDVATLLPTPELNAGPPRLHFRGQDFPLKSLSFSLGRHASCDLVFDSALYPTVSTWHCEIIYDRKTYFLRDCSRNGTLVNDRPVNQQTPLHPGDWIRLGPSGPLLRFLGQTTGLKKRITTA